MWHIRWRDPDAIPVLSADRVARALDGFEIAG
jgi:hypothetical protein